MSESPLRLRPTVPSGLDFATAAELDPGCRPVVSTRHPAVDGRCAAVAAEMPP